MAASRRITGASCPAILQSQRHIGQSRAGGLIEVRGEWSKVLCGWFEAMEPSDELSLYL